MATSQRRVQIKQRRASKRAEQAAVAAKQQVAARAQRLKGKVVVNTANLRPTGSYSTPDFVARGFYVDRAFTCKDCAAEQTWTATQQKWWYESAKGDVWTVAIRCRPCRRREQARKADARAVHLAGIAKRAR